MLRPVPARAPRLIEGFRASLVARRLPLLVGACAALPVVASVIRALAERWLPYDDRALGAVRAYDALSTHPPLVGTLAAYSLPNRPGYSPGPLHFWLLAVPSRIGPWALVVVVGLVNVVAVVAVVALAERRGGRAFMFVTAVAVALMAGSLPAGALHDMWEPYLTILPFTLLIFLCWSLACGAQRLLPVTVLVASFVVQCHVAYLVPAAAMLIVAGAGLAWSRSRLRAARPPLRRSLAIAGLVAVVCWSWPLIDQAIHRPGNLVNTVWYAFHRGTTVGTAIGWRAIVRVVGIPPWWLRSQRGIPGHFGDLLAAPSTMAVVSSIITLAALAGVLAWRARARDVELGAAAAIALLLCGSIGAVTAATPQRNALAATLAYTIDWGSPVGMWAWLTLALVAMRAMGASRVGTRLAVAPRRIGARPTGVGAAAGAAAALAAGAAVAAVGRGDIAAGEFRPMRSVVQRIKTDVGGARAVRIDFDWTWTTYEFAVATVYALRRSDIHPVAPQLTTELGGYYDPRRVRPQRFVFIRDTRPRAGPTPADAIRATVEADFRGPGGASARRDVVVTVTRTPGRQVPGGGGLLGPPRGTR